MPAGIGATVKCSSKTTPQIGRTAVAVSLNFEKSSRFKTGIHPLAQLVFNIVTSKIDKNMLHIYFKVCDDYVSTRNIV